MENATALGHGSLEISKRGKVAVRERLIQNRPEMLGRLKLRGVPGQVDQPDPVRNSQVGRGVPAGGVEPEHDDALPSRPGLARKQRQQRSEERLGHSVRHLPERLAGDRLHEGGHVEPLVAVMTKRDGALAFGAQTRRRIGLSPMRCSSVAQTSTGLSGCFALSTATACSSHC
jgi:hypothetical protein